MKYLFTWLLLCTVTLCKAQTNITPKQAKEHLNDTATVCGKLEGVYVSKEGNVFLNFGDKYPHQIFTAFISQKVANDSTKKFSFSTGQTICITGRIKENKGKPEIVVEDEKQITNE